MNPNLRITTNADGSAQDDPVTSGILAPAGTLDVMVDGRLYCSIDYTTNPGTIRGRQEGFADVGPYNGNALLLTHRGERFGTVVLQAVDGGTAAFFYSAARVVAREMNGRIVGHNASSIHANEEPMA